jgi:hypothetical protein
VSRRSEDEQIVGGVIHDFHRAAGYFKTVRVGPAGHNVTVVPDQRVVSAAIQVTFLATFRQTLRISSLAAL